MARIRTTFGSFIVASQPAPVQQAPVQQATTRPVTVPQVASKPAPQPVPVQTQQEQVATPVYAAPAYAQTAQTAVRTPAPTTRKTTKASATPSESYLDGLMEAATAVGAAAANAVASFFNLNDLRADLSKQVVAANGIAPAPTGSQTRNGAAPVDIASTQPAPSTTATGTSAGGNPEPVVEPDAGGTGVTYFVDFANGNDANSGTSMAQPWKRAPGDPLATGTAAAATLVGGDTVRFRGGVSYRGSIKVKSSGAQGAPITYTGTGFGTGNAVIDGADAASSSVPCPSQSACGNAANWPSLRLVTFTAPVTTYLKLYDALGPLSEAFVPNMADPFFGDDIESFVVTPKAAAAAIAAGRLDNAQLAAAALGQPQARVALWVQPNVVIERKILSISGGTIFFDPTDVKPYTDRDGRAAIVGSVKGLTRAGAYAMLGNGKAVVFPRSGGGTQFFIGTGRNGIDLNGAANIKVSGFRFLRATSAARSIREGIPVTSVTGNASNIVIENNVFGPLSMRSGYGAIHLNDGNNITIRANRFDDLQWSSGIRLAGATGAVIEGNRFNRGGRTGIYLQAASNVTVRRNIIAGYNGVHGNAISAYLGNRNISIAGNCVFGALRPLTFHGDDTSVQPNDLRISGNILVADAEGSAAIHSWGNNTRIVSITGNLLLGPKFGAILHAEDIGVTVTGNRTSGITQAGGAQPGDWVVANNDVSVDYATGRSAATLTIDRCSATGPSGNITVTPL